MENVQRFAVFRAARRIWAVGAVHAEVERLHRLHDALLPRMELCDRLVYLGNMIGRAPTAKATFEALLAFRITVLARPHSDAEDVVYLRGSQEEMWQKLLQLQFANDPRGVLQWMLDQGIGPTLESYGISVKDATREATAGVIALTRWTGSLRRAIRASPGHYRLMGALRRAAYTDDGALLFVNSGLDPARPLEAQSDSFWWYGGAFDTITEPYGSFVKVVRGFDPAHKGFQETKNTVTLDGGCGFGGPLLAACVTPDGEIVDYLEA